MKSHLVVRIATRCTTSSEKKQAQLRSRGKPRAAHAGAPFRHGRASLRSAIFCCELQSKLIRGHEDILSALVDRYLE